MSLILSGTDGLSDVDGSAATPAIRGTDTNTGIFFPAADTIAFSEGGVESMRLDSSGNLGLGVTPSAWRSTWSALQIGTGRSLAQTGSGAGDWTMAFNAFFDSTDNRWEYVYTGDSATRYSQTGAGVHSWFTAPSGTAGNAITFTQAMTLDASGNLLVGQTSQSFTANGFSVTGTGSGGYVMTGGVGDGPQVQLVNLTAAATVPNGFRWLSFRIGSTATEIGKIEKASSTTIAFTTSSDYRLKENITPLTGALAKVAAMRPVKWDWIGQTDGGEGFIAHELQKICPQAVVGEKDAMEEDGVTPRYQGVDTSLLVATLTAAIQEQQAIIQSLTARIEALEGTQP